MGWGGGSECHARSEPGPLDVIIDPLPPPGAAYVAVFGVEPHLIAPGAHLQLSQA